MIKIVKYVCNATQKLFYNYMMTNAYISTSLCHIFKGYDVIYVEKKVSNKRKNCSKYKLEPKLLHNE